MTKRFISVTELDDSGSACAVSQSLQLLPGGITPNLLINGGFDIWQRGTSFTETGYTADRWRADEADGAFTITREGFVLGQTDVPGEPEYYLKLDMTTASGSGNPTLEQRAEGVRTLAGQDATFSFYAKVASGTLTVTPRFRQSFGTGGSPSADVDTDGADITITDAWQRFEVTVSVPSISGKALGSVNNDYLSAMLVLPMSTFELDVSNAKLEAGDVSTIFVPRQYTDELQLCQRYALSLCDGPQQIIDLAVQTTTTQCVTYTRLHPEMRDQPTIEVSSVSDFLAYAGDAGQTVTVLEMAVGTSTNKAAGLKASWSGASGTINDCNTLYSGTSSSAYLLLDAEL